MATRRSTAEPTDARHAVAFVLQGGGALGAYQAGACEALAAQGRQPDWVAGISIGAINAALIAGNPPGQPIDRPVDGRQPRLVHAMSAGTTNPRPEPQAPGNASGARRRVLAAAAAVPLLGLGLTLGAQRPVRAAADRTPAPLRALDTAAMALFDAAQGSHWEAARRALAQARTAAEASATIEPAFLRAGGELDHFFEVRNNLGGDLMEAAEALSVKDRRWLVSCADRIAARAGELSQPFAQHAHALTPRIESLLYLARRMRRALVWGDTPGFSAAQEDFKRLWQSLRAAIRGQPAARLAALDDSLSRAARSRSAADAQALYLAVKQLRDGLE